jgi:hypothetical protein
VRVRFAGPAAEAVAKSRIGIGDEILLELDGAIWTESPAGLVSTPGRSVEGELVYHGILGLKVIGRDRDSDIQVLQNVSEERRYNTLATSTPIRPRQIDGLQDGEDGLANADLEPLHASPAFVRRLRLSGELFSSPVVDPFDDDDLDMEYVPRKRQRIEWRYADRSPSPSDPSQDQDSASHATDSPAVSSVPDSQYPSHQQTHHAFLEIEPNDSTAASTFVSEASSLVDSTPVAIINSRSMSLHSRDEREPAQASPIGRSESLGPSSPIEPSESPSKFANFQLGEQASHPPTQNSWVKNPVSISSITEKSQEEPGRQLRDKAFDEGSSHVDEAEDSEGGKDHSQPDQHGDAIDHAGAVKDDVSSQGFDGTYDSIAVSSDGTMADEVQPHVKTSKRLRPPSKTDPNDEEPDNHILSSSLNFTQLEHPDEVSNSPGLISDATLDPVEELPGMGNISDVGHLHDHDNAIGSASAGSMQSRGEASLVIIQNLEPTDEPNTPGQPSIYGFHDLTSPTMPQSGSSTRSSRERIMDQTYRSLFGFDSAPTIDDALLADHNDQTRNGARSPIQQDRTMADPDEIPEIDMFEVTFSIDKASERFPSQIEASSSLPAYSEESLQDAQLDTVYPLVGVESANARAELIDRYEEPVNYRTIGEADPINQTDLQHAFDHGLSAEGQISDIASARTEPGYAQLEGSIRSRMSMVASHILPPELAAGESPMRSTSERDAMRVQQVDEPEHDAVDHIAEPASSLRPSDKASLDSRYESDSNQEQLSSISVPKYLSSQSQDVIPPEETLDGLVGSTILDDSQRDNIASDPKIVYGAPNIVSATLRARDDSEPLQVVSDSRPNAASRSPQLERPNVATLINGAEQAESDEALNSTDAQTADHYANSATQDNQQATLSTQSLLRPESLSGNNLAGVEFIAQPSEAALDSHAMSNVTLVEETSLLPVDRQIHVNHDDSIVKDEPQSGDLAIINDSIATADGVLSSTAATSETPMKALGTECQSGSPLAHGDSAPEEVVTTPAARGLLTEQTPVTGGKSKARKSISARLGHVPDAISSWFSPRRSSRLRAGEEEKALPAEAPEEERSREESQPESQPKWAAMGIATSYSYFVPLSGLEKRLNSPGQPHHKTTIDVLSVITQNTKKPERAKSGPKDFFTVLSIIDPSVEDPTNAVTVEVFRPWHAQLPIAHAGDIVLLRDFAVKSRKRQPYLLSTDASAWCVWRYAMNEPDAGSNEVRPSPIHHTRASGLDDAREEVKGPPIELGEEERVRAGELHGWWQGLQEAGDAPLQEASKP